MEVSAAVSNPFAMMVAPEMIFATLERSDRLARLNSTICRPLDKPRPEKIIAGVQEFDEAIEAIEVAPEAPETDATVAPW